MRDKIDFIRHLTKEEMVRMKIFANVATTLGLFSLCGATFLLVGCEPAPERAWQPSDHAHPSGEPAPGKSREEAAKTDPILTVWATQCASCHGSNGRGDGPSKPMDMIDMSSPDWQVKSDDAIFAVIQQGKGMMPAFGEKFPEKTLRRLVAHIRSFKVEPPINAAVTPSEEPDAPSEILTAKHSNEVNPAPTPKEKKD